MIFKKKVRVRPITETEEDRIIRNLIETYHILDKKAVDLIGDGPTCIWRIVRHAAEHIDKQLEDIIRAKK